jgi:TolB-like protein
MKKYIFFIVLVFHGSVFCEVQKESIAVMDLSSNKISQSDLIAISERLRTEIHQIGKFNILERARINEILKEQGFQQSGCTDSKCAVEIGQLIGVKKIVIGTINSMGKIISIDLRIVDVKTGEILISIMEDCESCALEDVFKVSIHNAASKIVGLNSDMYSKPKQISASYNDTQYGNLKKRKITVIDPYLEQVLQYVGKPISEYNEKYGVPDIRDSTSYTDVTYYNYYKKQRLTIIEKQYNNEKQPKIEIIRLGCSVPTHMCFDKNCNYHVQGMKVGDNMNKVAELLGDEDGGKIFVDEKYYGANYYDAVYIDDNAKPLSIGFHSDTESNRINSIEFFPNVDWSAKK